MCRTPGLYCTIAASQSIKGHTLSSPLDVCFWGSLCGWGFFFLSACGGLKHHLLSHCIHLLCLILWTVLRLGPCVAQNTKLLTARFELDKNTDLIGADVHRTDSPLKICVQNGLLAYYWMCSILYTSSCIFTISRNGTIFILLFIYLYFSKTVVK